jgi:RND family efflux transporter MFP subunit
VEVINVQPQEFSVELPFSATISGLRQSAASAMIGGRIEKVLVKVGDHVEQDQVIMEFPEDAPAGQLQQAKAAHSLAKATYHRMKNLYQLGGISQQDLDGVETQYKGAVANLDAAMQMLKVRAPISGYVTSINVRETDGVHAEAILAMIAQTKQLKAKIWVTENEICQIEKGQIVHALWNDVTLKGNVAQVAMAQDPTTNAFGVDLIFDNAANLCKSGVIADIRVRTYSNPQTLLIPRKNLMNDEKGMFVYVVENNTAVKRMIKTGHDNGSLEIISGLKPGDKVISSSLNLVYDNAKVNVVN